MRLAYLNTEDLRKTSGGKVHYWAVASELARLGHTVDALAPLYGKGRWIPLEVDERVRMKPVRVPEKGVLALIVFELLVLLLLPWWKLRRGYDALLVRGGGVTAILGLVFLVARLFRIRVVLECNGVVWEEHRLRGSSPWMCALVKFMARQQVVTANALIGVTPEIRDAYLSLAWSRPAFAISNGVFTERIPFAARSQLRRARGWHEGVTVFVMPSEFAPWHGTLRLIDAIGCLPRSDLGSMRFVLPGTGRDFEAAQDRVRALGLHDQVSLPGLLTRERVYELLAAADVGLLFTQASGLPGSSLKLFEYLGAGLSVIAVRDSYLGALLPFYGLGELLPSASIDRISQSLLSATRSPQREARRLAIRSVAEQEFHWRCVARRVADVIAGRLPSLEEWLHSTAPSAGNSQRGDAA
jgi:glycosyltransferase involved in cell wall biosynthesis